MSLYKVFGCHAFVNIPKQKRRKNLEARSIQGIFVGLDRSSYPGYMVYSPEYHTTYVSGDVVFHPNHRFDGTLSDRHAGETAKETESVPSSSVDQFKYLEGTNHVDPDDGLLYKVLRVEEKTYRGQGRFIVAYRAQVLSDGRVSTKCERDAIHIRDIQKYHADYIARVHERFPNSLDSFGVNDSSKCSSSSNPSRGSLDFRLDSNRCLDNNKNSIGSGNTRSNRIKHGNSAALLMEERLSLFYTNDDTNLSNGHIHGGESLSTAAITYLDKDDEVGDVHYVNNDMYIEAAMCGDAIVDHCLAFRS